MAEYLVADCVSHTPPILQNSTVGVSDSSENRIEIDEDTLISTERPRLLLTASSYRVRSMTGLKISLDLHCSLTKVNRYFGSKKFSLMGFQNMVRMLDNLLIKLN